MVVVVEYDKGLPGRRDDGLGGSRIAQERVYNPANHYTCFSSCAHSEEEEEEEEQ